MHIQTTNDLHYQLKHTINAVIVIKQATDTDYVKCGDAGNSCRDKASEPSYLSRIRNAKLLFVELIDTDC